MFTKERKIDSENRKFLNERTEQYCFVLLERFRTVPVCNKTVVIIKSDWQFKTVLRNNT